MVPRCNLVEGDLLVHPPAGVSGWCRLPGQMNARAEIEILVDSVSVATISVSRDNDGGGCGRHAFSLILPVAPDDSVTCVIEARERRSGIVFGRAVLFEDAIARPIERRLAALDFGPLKRPLAAAPADPAIGLRRHFGALGAALLGTAGAASMCGDMADLARHVPRLPLSNTPLVSVILPAAPFMATTLRWLGALQSLADTTPIEVIVVDDGAEPLSALLPRLCPRLRTLHDASGLTGGVLNTLVRDARGEMLCFLDFDALAGDWQWPDLVLAGRQIHLGGRLARNFDVPEAACRREQHGFALYLARAEIFRAGGFEPALSGVACYTDFVVKCRQLGVGMTAWRANA